MKTHGRMRERRHIYSPLIYAHVYRFSRSRVCIRFARFLSGSSSSYLLSCLFTICFVWPRARKISKKDTLHEKKKSPSCDRHSFVVVRYVSMWYTRAHARLCLSFRYQRKGDRVHPLVSRSIGARAFSFSSLGKSWKDYLFLRARARAPKKIPKLSRLCERKWSFFFYNY